MEDKYWTSDDITFCWSKCDRKKCYRHPSHIHHHDIPHSFAYLEGTKYCEKYHDEKQSGSWQR